MVIVLGRHWYWPSHASDSLYIIALIKWKDRMSITSGYTQSISLNRNFRGMTYFVHTTRIWIIIHAVCIMQYTRTCCAMSVLDCLSILRCLTAMTESSLYIQLSFIILFYYHDVMKKYTIFSYPINDHNISNLVKGNIEIQIYPSWPLYN